MVDDVIAAATFLFVEDLVHEDAWQSPLSLKKRF